MDLMVNPTQMVKATMNWFICVEHIYRKSNSIASYVYRLGVYHKHTGIPLLNSRTIFPKTKKHALNISFSVFEEMKMRLNPLYFLKLCLRLLM